VVLAVAQEVSGGRLLAGNWFAGLAERVKGQAPAIRAVAEAVRLARAGLKNPRRPVVVFLFVGPSGTGKTELAKALADFLFRDEGRLIRFDMSEFMEEHSVAKLIGSPPGYVGHTEGGQLTDAIRTHPYSVVLFDEIEKAHPRVLDLFLQVFDEGTLTDGQGRSCSFRDAVIILTSNLGTGKRVAKIGFGAPELAPGPDTGRDAAFLDAVRGHLRPELVNRLSRVVVFQPLAADSVRLIIDKLLAALNLRLADKRVTITLDPSAYDLLLAEGFSEEFGARHMERVVEAGLAMPVAEEMLSGRITAGQTIRAEANDGVLRLRTAS
jgi:ATP-dependent Clp protease ATP-binding subunit ClpA